MVVLEAVRVSTHDVEAVCDKLKVQVPITLRVGVAERDCTGVVDAVAVVVDVGVGVGAEAVEVTRPVRLPVVHVAVSVRVAVEVQDMVAVWLKGRDLVGVNDGLAGGERVKEGEGVPVQEAARGVVHDWVGDSERDAVERVGVVLRLL